MHVIAMPQLGETVTEGTILVWLKQPGDAVEFDDGLFEVSTEKVDTEVPSAVAGVLRVQLVDEGDTVPIGTPVAVITATADEPLDLAELAGTRPIPEPGQPAQSPAAEPTTSEPAPEPTTSELGTEIGQVGPERVPEAVGEAGVGAAAGERRVLSPVVRRLLAEHGLAPDQVAGSGQDGRITRADVVAAAAGRDRMVEAAPAPAPHSPASSSSRPSTRPPVTVGERDRVVTFSRTRAATAAHMLESLGTAAHALVAVTVDYSAIDSVRGEAELSYLPFVARAVVEAIADFPHLNASVVDDDAGQRMVVHRDVNLGIAVDVDQEALMVPVVHRADQMRIGAISDAMSDLADRARRRRLAGEALSGGTFTITNVGSYGTLVSMPIINQPQVAILSTDGVRMAPVAIQYDDGSWGIAVHPVGNLCLSFDHRAFDGAYAAAFLARVRAELEDRDWASEVAP